ncbi:MAG: hypothetical protein ACJA2S_002947 [Cyclobacteriaceae bacterium]|jgi:hypothetical protein
MLQEDNTCDSNWPTKVQSFQKSCSFDGFRHFVSYVFAVFKYHGTLARGYFRQWKALAKKLELKPIYNILICHGLKLLGSSHRGFDKIYKLRYVLDQYEK